MGTDDLLKLATKEKESGNYEQSCIYLKQAYATMDQSPIWYTVETYLRLPSYLQMAGKPKEAWGAFEQLIKNGYPHQPTAPGLKAFDLATTFDKMRLFLQREKQWYEAVIYGIGAYILKREAYSFQKREKEVAFEDSAAGKTKLIKQLNAKGVFSIASERLDLELASIINKDFYNRPTELVETIRKIITKCFDEPKIKRGFDEKSIRELIKAQWLLIPDNKAFKKAASLYRKLIQGKAKLKLEVKNDIRDFYKISVLYELLFETNLVKPTVKVKNLMPKGQEHVAYSIAQSIDCYRLYKQIEPDYTIIGHKQLTMLNQKDSQIIEQAFGLPVSHIKPRVFFEKIWLEIVQKFEDSVISNFNALKKELKSFLKAS
ncbi:MAG: hypothetical protein EOM80_02230 [Erysipelotrichia bacterium]|nr:hypothetical protein [Erysipelotrichia bacterium]